MGSSQPHWEFRPARSKFWAPLLVGAFILTIGAAFLLLPALAGWAKFDWALIIVGLCGALMTWLGSWLFYYAFGLRKAVVRIDEHCLELNAQRWALWKRKLLRHERLSWQDVHGGGSVPWTTFWSRADWT